MFQRLVSDARTPLAPRRRFAKTIRANIKAYRLFSTSQLALADWLSIRPTFTSLNAFLLLAGIVSNIV